MNLTKYDIILISSSAGKDSQAMTDLVSELAIAQGVEDRLVLVHCDLGSVEWAGTRDLVQEHADHYRIPLHVLEREQGGFLELVESRGKWPGSSTRFCTSYLKRDQVAKLITRLTNEREQDTPVRILSCMGMRAQESPARAKKQQLSRNVRLSNSKRIVDDWLPIHDWTLEQVWERIHESGVRYHQAYDLGMPRLSCVFCIFAPREALRLAGEHNPELLDRMVDLEEKIGHKFKSDLSLAQVRDDIKSSPCSVQVTDWRM